MGEKADQQSQDKKVFDDKRRAELIAGYKSSGLSQREYALREGVDYNMLGAWLWQQQRTAVPFAVMRPMPDSSTGELEVTLPSKIVVRGRDAAEVARLVNALKNFDETLK